VKKSKHKLTLFASIISLTLLLTISTLLFSMYLDREHSVTSTTIKQISDHTTKLENFTYKNYSATISLAAVGDILIHGTVYKDAKTNEGYDFKPNIASVKHLLQSPDITIANQETILGGSEIGLSTYPQFNSPYEVADALSDAGVDIVSIANNHTLDRGEKAVFNATAYLDKIGMEYVGGYRDQADKERIRVLNRNGIRIAFLSYTYGTNGIPVPKGKEYLVNLIDPENIKVDIAAAKQVADVLAVSMHWGNEYQLYPNDEQKSLAQMLANEGVDLIIGHHPHVLQPMEWITREDGNKTFVVYSLGNFLSGQVKNYKDIGGILQIDITKQLKDNTSTVTLHNPQFTPTYVTSTDVRRFQVVPLETVATSGTRYAASIFEEMDTHMKQWLD
jgi:poly-gamma-glutamate capsule biosynthesis protein CapA/YwtB (metallophosphatase superfamily)